MKKRVCDIVVSGQDRAEHDFYATPPEAVKFLLNVEKFDRNIWECASGMNHIADVLKEYGYYVRTSDIVKRTPTTEKKDFLKCRWKWHNGAIITNPPFTLGKEFAEKSLSLVDEGHKVALFLRMQFLDGLHRYELFEENPPKRVYVFSRRVRCAKDGEFSPGKSGGLQSYCWFVWEKGFKGDTVVKWINHDEELDEEKMRAPRIETVNEEIKQKEPRARIIYFWNQNATDAVCLVRSLYNKATGTDGFATQVGIEGDKIASTTPSIFQVATSNSHTTVSCQSITLTIPTVGWRVGGYEMPQCTARGTPQTCRNSIWVSGL